MKKVVIFSIVLVITILWIDFFTKIGIFWSIDSIFFPINSFKPFFSQTIFWHFRDFINIFFWYQIFAKIWLVWILLIWVFLWYKISKLVFNIFDIKENTTKELLSILSISFVLINPFIFERLSTQVWIALAIYLIWLWLVYLLEYLLIFKNKKLYFSSLFFWLALTIMPHTAVFVTIIFILTLAFFFKKFNIKNILISIFIFLFVNLNWIIWAFFLNENKTVNTVKSFNKLNIDAFTTNNLSGGVEFTNLLLYWFWAEKYNNRVLKPENDWWILAGIVILGIIVYWAINLYRKNKKLSLYLISLWATSYILWCSISSNIFWWISEIFYKYVPYYIWMREPQKLTWLLMIIYAIFFVIWVYFVFENYSNFKNKEKIKKLLFNKYSISIYIFLLLIVWSPNTLFWFNWWLKITDYPKEIQTSKDFLEKNNIRENVLILPWHSYTACAWTDGKVIANPLQYYLKPIKAISADNIEIEKLYSNSNNSRTKQIEKFLKTKDFNILKKLKIDTIYFTDYCADFTKYRFLDKSKNLEKIFNSKFIKIYKIK